MELITQNTDKETVFNKVESWLNRESLTIKKKDDSRPWGGFFVIDDSSLEDFIKRFFPDIEQKYFDHNHTLSPKILLVEPGKRLSWQYHHRRSEIWRVAKGKAGVVLSDDDEQNPAQSLKTGDVIKIEQGIRHRLVGLEEWGVIAEIWMHTDPCHPSDENDIVRLEDDFGR